MTNRDTDGTNDAIYEGDDIPRGMVVRMRNPVNASGVQDDPFSDMIVVEVVNTTDVKLARPYVYTTAIGSILTGVETFTVGLSSLRKNYMKVLSSRGKPMTMVMGLQGGMITGVVSQ